MKVFSQCVIQTSCEENRKCYDMSSNYNCHEVELVDQAEKFSTKGISEGVKSLHTLRIKNSQLSVSTHFVDDRFSSLKVLEFSDVNITEFKDDCFDNLIKLNSLKFNDMSSLTSLPEKLLIHLVSLKTFSAMRCNLTSIEPKFFQNNLNLKNIFLSKNFLISVDNETFRNLNQLTILNLSGNNLKYVDFSVFSNNLKLEKIDLSFNQIASIDWSIATHLNQLTVLNLLGNVCNISINHWNICKIREYKLDENCATKDSNSSYTNSFCVIMESAEVKALNFDDKNFAYGFVNVYEVIIIVMAFIQLDLLASLVYVVCFLHKKPREDFYENSFGSRQNLI